MLIQPGKSHAPHTCVPTCTKLARTLTVLVQCRTRLEITSYWQRVSSSPSSSSRAAWFENLHKRRLTKHTCTHTTCAQAIHMCTSTIRQALAHTSLCIVLNLSKGEIYLAIWPNKQTLVIQIYNLLALTLPFPQPPNITSRLPHLEFTNIAHSSLTHSLTHSLDP